MHLPVFFWKVGVWFHVLLVVSAMVAVTQAVEVVPPPGGSTASVLRIAVLNTEQGRFQYYGKVYRNIFTMFQRWVASVGGIQAPVRNATTISTGGGGGGGPPSFFMNPTAYYQIEVVYLEVGADLLVDMKTNVAREAQNIKNGAYDPIDAVFAPYGSDLTPPLADTVNDRLIFAPWSSASSVFQCSADILSDPTKCYNSSSDPPRRYRNVFGTLAKAGDYFDLGVQFARFKKAKALGLICEDNVFGREACEGARNMSNDVGLTIAAEVTYSTSAVSTLKSKGVDYLIAAVYADTCESILEQMSSLGWVPSGTMISTCVGRPSLVQNIPAATPYIMGPLQWHRLHDDVSYREPQNTAFGGRRFLLNLFPFVAHGKTSAQQFYDNYTAMFGEEPTYHAASALVSLYTFNGAFSFARSFNYFTTIDDVSFFTRTGGMNTFWGHLGYDSVGQMDQSDDFTLTQYDGANALQVLTPVRIATASIVYPSPTYAQRTCLALTTPECSGNGECQTSGVCKCFEGYSGQTCSSKQLYVQTIMQQDGCKGVWIAALVLLIIFLIALGISIFFCCDRRKLQQAKEAMERAANQAAAQLPTNLANALPGLGGGGGGGYGVSANSEKLEA